jgi:hypothetical protein
MKRTRHWIAVAAAALALITAAAWIVSGWRTLDWCRSTQAHWGAVAITRGNLDLVLGSSAADPARPGTRVTTAPLEKADLDAALKPPSAPTWRWSIPKVLTATSGGASAIRLIVPLWLLFLVSAVAAGVPWYINQRGPRGSCRSCG